MVYLFKEVVTGTTTKKRLEIATLDDIQAYLSWHGLVAVKLEPTEAMKTRGMIAHQECGHASMRQCARASFMAMIAAQGETK